jgi:hypothetical protein
MADNLPPSSADFAESGSLNLPEPSGSHRPVMGLLYLLLCILLANLLKACCNIRIRRFKFAILRYNSSFSKIQSAWRWKFRDKECSLYWGGGVKNERINKQKSHKIHGNSKQNNIIFYNPTRNF